MSNEKLKEFLSGARDTIPLLIGALPFGLIYGTLAVTTGLSVYAAMAMSLFVFAGSAQFIAVGLISFNTPLPVIILTTFIVNLRHMLYSASLLPYIKDLPKRWLVPLAFWLTDETYAVTILRYSNKKDSQYKHWFQLGSSLAMYLNWQLWCFIGLVVGRNIPDATNWGLDVAMPIAFIGMTIPFVKDKSVFVSIFTAGFLSILTYSLPYKSGLIVSSIAGVFAGLLYSRLFRNYKKEIKTGD